MAKVIVSCPKCKGKLSAPEGAERFRCPTCKTVLSAPKASDARSTLIEAVEGGTPASQVQAPLPSPEPAPAPRPQPQPQPQAKPEAQPQPRPVFVPRAEQKPPSEPAPVEAPQGEAQMLGKQLSGYTITRVIGRGSMGTVYEAIQEGLKRRVAIKVLPEAMGRDPVFLANFKRDAQAVAKLSHPNIVRIFDIDEAQGYQFFSMEYVDGENLATRVSREGRLAPSDALPIIGQVAAALEHAYEHMLVHRDIKPGNILLTQRGEAKLADLGLSKSLEETTVGGARGIHAGVLYTAPELAKTPQLADCRSDIYALGIVLFEALTGKPPFQGPTVADLMNQHATAALPSVRKLAPSVPEDVDALIRKMCAKDPADRFQTHGELLERLEGMLRGTGSKLIRLVEGCETTERPKRSVNWLPWAAGGAAAFVLILAAVVFLPPLLRARPKAAKATTAAPVPPKKSVETKPPAEKRKVVEPVAVPKVPTPEIAEPKEPEPKVPAPKVEEPKEEPKNPDAPAWAAKLAQAKKAADAFVAQKQFGKAVEAYEAATKDDDTADLKTAADEAKAAIQKQAAGEFEKVGKSAQDLVAAGKVDDARAALQAVVDTFGTTSEVEKAQTAVAALDKLKEGRAAIEKGAQEATAAADAAARRAAQQAEASKAIAAANVLVENWQLDEAAEALGKLKCDDAAVAAQVEQRKAAVAALAAFRDAASEQIRAASPRLRKSDLRVSGLNGEFVGADAAGLTAEVATGGEKKAEKIPWATLGEGSVERLAKRVAKPGDASHQLALGVWLGALGLADKAAPYLVRAAALGAKTDALTDPAQAAEKAQAEAQAARAFADSLKLILGGKLDEAAAALGSYKEKFSATDHYAAHQPLFDVALAFRPYAPPGAEPPTPKPPAKEPEPKQPEPKQPAPKQPAPKPLTPEDEKKAKELYDKAVAAFTGRQYGECKKLLDELKEAAPGAPLLTDQNLKPPVPAMLAALDALGPTLKVGSAKGAHVSLEKALAALDKPASTIEIDGSVVGHGPVVFPETLSNGLVVRGVGDRRPRFSGGAKRDVIFKLPSDGKDLWVESIEFGNATYAVDVDTRCTVSLRHCIAVSAVKSAVSKLVTSKVTAEGCIFHLENLTDLPSRGCAYEFADKAAIENAQLTACVLVGNDLELKNVTLTDCLLLGTATLSGGTKLIHVTVAGGLTVREDERNVAITDSIVGALEIAPPARVEKGKKKEIAVTLKNVALFAQTKALPKDTVASEEVSRARSPFAGAASGDYRLPKDSPLRDKASDKSELGSRFPPELLDILRLARSRSFSQFLKPPTRHK